MSTRAKLAYDKTFHKAVVLAAEDYNRDLPKFVDDMKELALDPSRSVAERDSCAFLAVAAEPVAVETHDDGRVTIRVGEAAATLTPIQWASVADLVYSTGRRYDAVPRSERIQTGLDASYTPEELK